MSDNTTAVPTLTPAQKRKATRERKKAELKAAVAARWEAFEAMPEKVMDEMIAAIEEIKDEYRAKLDELEEQLNDEARDQMLDVVNKYGWDETKAYLEGDFNGREHVSSILDLEHIVDEWKDQPEPKSDAEHKTMLNDQLATWTAKAGDLAQGGTHVVIYDQESPDDVVLIRELTPAEKQATKTCGTCQRPWINGKCSGGFINHKL